MVKLKFFDLKEKKAFTTDKFKIEERGKRRFAIAESPSGTKSFRIVGKDFKG